MQKPASFLPFSIFDAREQGINREYVRTAPISKNRLDIALFPEDTRQRTGNSSACTITQCVLALYFQQLTRVKRKALCAACQRALFNNLQAPRRSSRGLSACQRTNRIAAL